MLRLTRAVRFAINPAAGPLVAPSGKDPNGYAGTPSMQGLGCHYELVVRCVGEVDKVTGYLVDIKDVDTSVRTQVVPVLARACSEEPMADPGLVLADAMEGLQKAIGPAFESVQWKLSPYYSVQVNSKTDNPAGRTPTVSLSADSPARLGSMALLRQRFDFAAAHRLDVPELSLEQNRALFGKCNNPSGHGHNYQFEPCVAVPLVRGGPPVLTLQDLERLSQSSIIDRFDHKHLNQDTEEFCVARGGVNPSVENIARVFYELLAAAISAESKEVALHSMTVWETDRTSATYPA